MEMLLKQSSHYYAKKSDEVGADIEKDDDQISLWVVDHPEAGQYPLLETVLHLVADHQFVGLLVPVQGRYHPRRKSLDPCIFASVIFDSCRDCTATTVRIRLLVHEYGPRSCFVLFWNRNVSWSSFNKR